MVDSPIALLKQIEVRCRENAAGIPAMEDVRAEWVGISFRVAGQEFVASMDQVAEILTVPSSSKVPGVKSWVVGVANLRGNLLPIMDLKGFLSDKNVEFSKHIRLLVINIEGLYTSLLVESVAGLKHFYTDNRKSRTVSLDKAMQPYSSESFVQDGKEWPVFDMAVLARSQDFLDVAA